MHKWMETRNKTGKFFLPPGWMENGMICAQRGVIRTHTNPVSVHPEGTVEQRVVCLGSLMIKQRRLTEIYKVFRSRLIPIDNCYRNSTSISSMRLRLEAKCWSQKSMDVACGEEMGQLMNYRTVRYVRFLPSLDAPLLPSDPY